MAKWKNYRKDEKKNGYSQKEEEMKSPETKKESLEEEVAKTNQEAANRAARFAMFASQKAQIDEAVSVAKSKGINTEGTVVGLHAMQAGVTEGQGTAVADIGIENEIEANELDPNAGTASGSNSDSNSDGNNGDGTKEEQEEELDLSF